MSGGEVQRVGLARTFAHARRVVVLDDVAASLDTVTEHHIGAVLTGALSHAHADRRRAARVDRRARRRRRVARRRPRARVRAPRRAVARLGLPRAVRSARAAGGRRAAGDQRHACGDERGAAVNRADRLAAMRRLLRSSVRGRGREVRSLAGWSLVQALPAFLSGLLVARADRRRLPRRRQRDRLRLARPARAEHRRRRLGDAPDVHAHGADRRAVSRRADRADRARLAAAQHRDRRGRPTAPASRA